MWNMAKFAAFNFETGSIVEMWAKWRKLKELILVRSLYT